MKLWGDVPWEGGPRKVRCLILGDCLDGLVYAGVSAETKHMVVGPRGRVDPLVGKTFVTLLPPWHEAAVVYGEGDEIGAGLRKKLAELGYRIRWR